jgi:hypothetical protein
MPIMDSPPSRFWGAIDKLSQTWPAKMAQSAYDAVRLPGQVAGGIMNTPPAQPGMWSDEDEARQQATQGTMMNRAADLGGLVTGGSYAAAPAMKDATGMGIRAYHGSPHDFDKFDLSKIGTGEGAQAYGHGLYFAEKEGVAKAYRDALTPKRNTTVDGGKYNADDSLHNAAVMLEKFNGDRDAAMAWMRGSESMKPTFDILQSGVALPSQAVKPGRMYEVDIKANPEQFLDWDKPFSSPDALEQFASKFDATDPVLRKRIEDYGYVRQKMGSEMPDGNDIVREILGGIGSADAVRASRTMNEAGIPGIKYLDQGSRRAGEGSSNYVVFDDKLVDILRKYGIMGASAIPGMGLMGSESPAQAAP